MSILYMSEGNNFFVSGWNFDEHGNLWLTRTSGGSKMVAEGQEAIKMHDTLCMMGVEQFPTVMHHNGAIKTNLD